MLDEMHEVQCNLIDLHAFICHFYSNTPLYDVNRDRILTSANGINESHSWLMSSKIRDTIYSLYNHGYGTSKNYDKVKKIVRKYANDFINEIDIAIKFLDIKTVTGNPRHFDFPLIGSTPLEIENLLLNGHWLSIGQCCLQPNDGVIWGTDVYGCDDIAANELSSRGVSEALNWAKSQSSV